MADTNPSAPSTSASTEFPCPDCGEMVREGLVRCWNCGGFLRSEMEQRFQKMQAKPQRVILSAPTEEAAGGADLDEMMSGRVSTSEADGDDFQLSSATQKVAAPSISGAAPVEVKTPAEGDAATRPTAQTAAAPTADGGDVPHSVATGGDALMELAAAEELEKLKRQGSRPASIEGVKVIRDGFLIDAPKGCRIQIRDERTGELRRLTFGASSRVRISMLDKLEAIAKARQEKETKQLEGPKHVTAGKYQRWMSDVHLHTINPAKLKLVADSLTKEFAPVEVGFAVDELLVVSLPSGKKGMFGGGKSPQTPDGARDALLQYLRAGKSLEGENVPVAGDVNIRYSSDQIAEIRAVQPAASLSESLFAGIPVFGAGRIAVQLPVKEAGEQPKVLSFTLSQFREFLEIIGPMYSLAEFGHNLGIPLADTFEEHKCHYSGAIIKALGHFEFYNADPALETVLGGYKCEACGIAVSEAAREKEKLGGKGGKGIAKAKCPKCGQKMGNVPLSTLASSPAEPSMQDDDSDSFPTAASGEASTDPPA